jgi:endonuclease YncB( thermonuclease family)
MYPLPVLIVVLVFGVAHARIAGVATVTDGDTIEVHGREIRLHGIDAFEARQTCEHDGKPWRCGAAAANALSDQIARRPVACEERGRDRHGRTLAVCTVDGEEMNAWLVREGWALAYREYSRDYVDEEAAAKAARRGAWRGTFTPPWKWRAQHPRRPGSTRAPVRSDRDGCRIKGNVNAAGADIYHLPGDRDYAATRIDPSRGERWFCSEEEAKAAGWRRARQ